EELSDKLKQIALSQLEFEVLELKEEDIRLSAEECKTSLIGKVIGERKAHLSGIKRTMGMIWQIQNPME
ncbi:Unknown protein, partial [Striga hermonthica]